MFGRQDIIIIWNVNMQPVQLVLPLWLQTMSYIT